ALRVEQRRGEVLMTDGRFEADLERHDGPVADDCRDVLRRLLLAGAERRVLPPRSPSAGDEAGRLRQARAEPLRRRGHPGRGTRRALTRARAHAGARNEEGREEPRPGPVHGTSSENSTWSDFEPAVMPRVTFHSPGIEKMKSEMR